MKSKSSRFSDANKFLDSKLDKLFSEQESSKTGEQLEGLRKGGKIRIKPSKVGSLHTALGVKQGAKIPSSKLTIHPGDSPGLKKKKQFALNAKKWKHAEGGELKPKLAKAGTIDTSAFKPNPIQPVDLSDVNNFGKTSYAKSDLVNEKNWATLDAGFNPPSTPAGSTPINWNTALQGAATFLPNAISAAMQKKLQGPPTPVLQGKSKFKEVSADPYLAENTRQYQGALKNLGNKVGQASSLASNAGSLFSRKVAADNAAIGNVQQINAGIQANKARLDTIVEGNNTATLNQQRYDKRDFDNSQKVRTTDNAANLSGKILGQIAQQNQIDRDKFALEVMSKAYGDSGIFNRNINQLLDEYFKKKGLAKGGKLGKLNKKKSK